MMATTPTISRVQSVIISVRKVALKDFLIEASRTKVIWEVIQTIRPCRIACPRQNRST